MERTALRVLLVHNRYRQPGGEDAVVLAQAALLESSGHLVALHEVRNPEGLRASAAVAAAPWNARAASGVGEAVERFGADVVHVHNTWFRLSPAVFAAVHGAARVASLHNFRVVCLRSDLYRDGARCTSCLGRSPARGVVQRCYRHSAAQSAVAAATIVTNRVVRSRGLVDVLIAPSATAVGLLVRGGVDEGRLRVVPNPVPDPGPRPRPPSASRTVVYAGRAEEAKGLPELLAAWRRARPEPLELHLLGVGNDYPPARAVPGVVCVPWLPVDQVRRALLSARAVVAPTRMVETFGLTAVEGLAAGLPALVSAGGALAEVVGEVGPPPVPIGDVDAWGTALSGLLHDADVDAWGARGRARYDVRFSGPVALRALEEAYGAACSTARAGRAAS